MYRLDWPDRAILGEGEIPADPALPQLATLLDERAMGRILQVELPGEVLEGRYSIEGCRVAHVRYRPGRDCLVGYKLEVGDPATGQLENNSNVFFRVRYSF